MNSPRIALFVSKENAVSRERKNVPVAQQNSKRHGSRRSNHHFIIHHWENWNNVGNQSKNSRASADTSEIDRQQPVFRKGSLLNSKQKIYNDRKIRKTGN